MHAGRVDRPYASVPQSQRRKEEPGQAFPSARARGNFMCAGREGT